MTRRLLLALAAAAAVAVAAWALYGYTFGSSVQHGLYLPWVLAELDPALFPNDPVLPALGRAPTCFWGGVARLSAFFGLEGTCWWLWMGSRVAAFLASFAAAIALGGGMLGAAFSAALVLLSAEVFIASPIAGDPMLRSFLDASSFCWPFGLLAVALWLSGRRALAAAGLGLLSYLNPMLGLILAAWLGLADLLERRSVPRTLSALAPFAVCVAPLAFRLLASRSAPDMEIMEACIPGIYSALRWPWERWLHLAVAMALCAAVFHGHPRRASLFPLLGSAALLWGVAIAGPRWFATAQLSRLDVALVWVALCASGPLLLERFQGPGACRSLCALAAFWAMGSAFGSMTLTAYAACLVLADGHRRVSPALGFAALVWGCGALFLPPGSLFHLGPTVALGVAVIGGFLAVAGWTDLLRAPFARHLAAGLPSLMLVFPILHAVALRPALSETRRPGPIEDWARTTPPDTLFIVPPDCSGFRLHARRPVYAEWGDFSIALWDPEAARSWKERMTRLGVDWETLPDARAEEWRAWTRGLLRRVPVLPAGGIPAWSARDGPRLARLARETGASYIVAPAEAGLSLPVAFASGGIVVHRPR